MNKKQMTRPVIYILKISAFCAAILVFNLGVFAEPAIAIEEKAFGGSIDFIDKNLDFRLDLKERGAIDIKGGINDSSEYNLNLCLRHFRIGKADIRTDFLTKGTVNYSKDGKIRSLEGKAWTQATLLNHKPLKEFQISYEIDQHGLKINSSSWAELSLRGQVVFKPSMTVDLVLVIENANLRGLAEVLGIDAASLGLEGTASGAFKIKGQLAAADISGRLSVLNGRLSSIEFNSAKINLSGSWPVLRFVNSSINATDGIEYGLRGNFNLKALMDASCPDNRVMVYSANNAIRFQDWVIKRQADVRGHDMVEAEYSLKKNQALRMRIKDEEESLAWEKKIKF